MGWHEGKGWGGGGVVKQKTGREGVREGEMGTVEFTSVQGEWK